MTHKGMQGVLANEYALSYFARVRFCAGRRGGDYRPGIEFTELSLALETTLLRTGLLLPGGYFAEWSAAAEVRKGRVACELRSTGR